jgi:hypothetical protein
VKDQRGTDPANVRPGRNERNQHSRRESREREERSASRYAPHSRRHPPGAGANPICSRFFTNSKGAFRLGTHSSLAGGPFFGRPEELGLTIGAQNQSQAAPLPVWLLEWQRATLLLLLCHLNYRKRTDGILPVIEDLACFATGAHPFLVRIVSWKRFLKDRS